MSNNIDKIFYINLEKRADRRKDIEEEFKQYNLEVERFVGIEHDPGIVGCGKSHLAVMKIAKQRGYKNVLILEDDFTFLFAKNEFEAALDQFFSTVPKYDVCMLCCNMVNHEPIKPYPFLHRIIEASNASGYIIHGDYLDTLIALYEEAIPLLERTGEHWNYANDQVWKRLQKKDVWYVFSPRIGKQRSGYSDNAKAFMDYDT